jgi:hypothetical protein
MSPGVKIAFRIGPSLRVTPCKQPSIEHFGCLGWFMSSWLMAQLEIVCCYMPYNIRRACLCQTQQQQLYLAYSIHKQCILMELLPSTTSAGKCTRFFCLSPSVACCCVQATVSLNLVAVCGKRSSSRLRRFRGPRSVPRSSVSAQISFALPAVLRILPCRKKLCSCEL